MKTARILLWVLRLSLACSAAWFVGSGVTRWFNEQRQRTSSITPASLFERLQTIESHLNELTLVGATRMQLIELKHRLYCIKSMVHDLNGSHPAYVILSLITDSIAALEKDVSSCVNAATNKFPHTPQLQQVASPQNDS